MASPTSSTARLSFLTTTRPRTEFINTHTYAQQTGNALTFHHLPSTSTTTTTTTTSSATSSSSSLAVPGGYTLDDFACFAARSESSLIATSLHCGARVEARVYAWPRVGIDQHILLLPADDAHVLRLSHVALSSPAAATATGARPRLATLSQGGGTPELVLWSTQDGSILARAPAGAAASECVALHFNPLSSSQLVLVAERVVSLFTLASKFDPDTLLRVDIDLRKVLADERLDRTITSCAWTWHQTLLIGTNLGELIVCAIPPAFDAIKPVPPVDELRPRTRATTAVSTGGVTVAATNTRAQQRPVNWHHATPESLGLECKIVCSNVSRAPSVAATGAPPKHDSMGKGAFRIETELEDPSSSVDSLAVSRRHVFAGLGDGSLQVLELGEFRSVHATNVSPQHSSLCSTVFNPVFSDLVAYSADGSTHQLGIIGDIREAQRVALRPKGKRSSTKQQIVPEFLRVTPLGSSPFVASRASASQDGVWTNPSVQSIPLHMPSSMLEQGPSTSYVLSFTREGRLLAWKHEAQAISLYFDRQLDLSPGEYITVAASAPSGQLLAVGFNTGVIALLNVTELAESDSAPFVFEGQLPDNSGAIVSILFPQDATQVIVASASGKMLCLSIATTTQAARFASGQRSSRESMSWLGAANIISAPQADTRPSSSNTPSVTAAALVATVDLCPKNKGRGALGHVTTGCWVAGEERILLATDTGMLLLLLAFPDANPTTSRSKHVQHVDPSQLVVASATTRLTGRITSMSSVGSLIAVGLDDRNVHLFSISNDALHHEAVLEFQHEKSCTAVSLSPSGRFLAHAGADGAVFVRSLSGNAPLDPPLITASPVSSERGGISSLTWCETGTAVDAALICAGRDGGVVAVDVWQRENSSPFGVMIGSRRGSVAVERVEPVEIPLRLLQRMNYTKRSGARELQTGSSAPASSSSSMPEVHVDAESDAAVRRLRQRLDVVRERLETLLAQNATADDLEKLDRLEFSIDRETRQHLEADGVHAADQLRAEIEEHNVGVELLKTRILEECWDSQEPDQQRRSFTGFRSQVEVSSMPVSKWPSAGDSLYSANPSKLGTRPAKPSASTVDRLETVNPAPKRLHKKIKFLRRMEMLEEAWNAKTVSREPLAPLEFRPFDTVSDAQRSGFVADIPRRYTQTVEITTVKSSPEAERVGSAASHGGDSAGPAAIDAAGADDALPMELAKSPSNKANAKPAEKTETDVAEEAIRECEDLMYHPLDCITRSRCITQALMVQLRARARFRAYNAAFESMYQRKQECVDRIGDINKRVADVQEELKEEHDIWFPPGDPCADPESLFIVRDDEVTADKVMSVAERARREAEAEAERIRLANRDDAPDRALDDMMGGQVKRKRDLTVLEQTLERPAWMDSISQARMTDEQLVAVATFEKRFEALQNEQAARRKYLRTERKKLLNDAAEIMRNFDNKLTALFEQQMRTRQQVDREESFVSGLLMYVATMDERDVLAMQVKERLKSSEAAVRTASYRLDAFSARVEQVASELADAQAESRLFERRFRTEFRDANESYDQLERMFKARTRRKRAPTAAARQAAMLETLLHGDDGYRESATGQLQPATMGKRSSSGRMSNTGRRRSSHRRSSRRRSSKQAKEHDEEAELHKPHLIEDLHPLSATGAMLMVPDQEDPEAKQPQIQQEVSVAGATAQDESAPQCDYNDADRPETLEDDEMWARFLQKRAQKLAQEARLKQLSAVHAEHIAHAQQLTAELERAEYELDVLATEHQRIELDRTRVQLNTMVSLFLKQGQVELDDAAVVPDLTDAVVVHRNVIESVNSSVRALGETSLKLLRRRAKRDRDILQLQWKRKALQLSMFEAVEMTTQVQLLRVTKNLQSLIKAGGRDKQVAHEVEHLERKIQYARKSAEERHAVKASLYQQLTRRHRAQLLENDRLLETVKGLESVVRDRLQVKRLKGAEQQRRRMLGAPAHGQREDQQASAMMNEAAEAERRIEDVMLHRRLKGIAKLQDEELALLRDQVDKLRHRTFAIFDPPAAIAQNPNYAYGLTPDDRPPSSAVKRRQRRRVNPDLTAAAAKTMAGWRSHSRNAAAARKRASLARSQRHSHSTSHLPRTQTPIHSKSLPRQEADKMVVHRDEHDGGEGGDQDGDRWARSARALPPVTRKSVSRHAESLPRLPARRG